MDRSIFSELKYKVFQSGSRVNLFIGINVIVFLSIHLIGLVELLSTRDTALKRLIVQFLSMPSDPGTLLWRFWTPFTYMFVHEDFFHILFNMLGLFWLGRIFEDFLNKKQFTFTYIFGGLTGGLLYFAAYNLLPFFDRSYGLLLGASGSVMAIIGAVATLVPNYTVFLFLFGEVKLKYLALVYVLIDIIFLLDNPGGSFAHLGGFIAGMIFVRQLQRGNDWSKLFQKKKKLTVVKGSGKPQSSSMPDQEVIDRILDKISKSGYDSLTRQEKEQLFNASKTNDTKKG